MEGKKSEKLPSSGIYAFPSEELARLWRIPFPTEMKPGVVELALHERIKELNCLYGISQLAERHLNSLDDLLQELVDFLPYSWQYPEITCTRILYKGKTYTSRNFRLTPWRQSSLIYMYHEPVGECAVFYLEECSPADEGPFLQEERALLDAIAEQIGTIATRISADIELQETNRELNLERKALQEANNALKLVLARIEQEKQEIHKDIKTNVDAVLMPIINALILELATPYKKYVELLKSNLEDIASPFVNKLSFSFSSLTPIEISICNMIKSGMRTKEIAEMRNVSEATINRHREKIRRKLKLTNQNVNMMSFLQSHDLKVSN